MKITYDPIKNQHNIKFRNLSLKWVSCSVIGFVLLNIAMVNAAMAFCLMNEMDNVKNDGSSTATTDRAVACHGDLSKVDKQAKTDSTKPQTHTIYLIIDEKQVNYTGNTATAIAVNEQIPAPTLMFNEGDRAIIHVKNNLNTETSIHWHGLLLPNIQDGVPYLTTAPILANATYTYTFKLKHAGTYWYHSHTDLQEQIGVYGAIVVNPSSQNIETDYDLTVVLSDWTDKNPSRVLKNLKRGSEWSSIVRNTSQPLIPSIAKGLLKQRWILYKNKMPDMHISDINYDAFLSNGQLAQHYSDFSAGKKVRIRLINAGASTYFWVNSAEPLEVIAADGVDVEPIKIAKLLIAIGETYDIRVTVPDRGQLEIKSTAMDGSGDTSIYLGKGDIIKAKNVAVPNYFELMEKVAKLHSDSDSDNDNGGHQGHLKVPYVKIIEPQQSIGDHRHHHLDNNSQAGNPMRMAKSQRNEPMHHTNIEANVVTDFNYDFLKSKQPTARNKPTREIMLNLDADMLRYIWTINGKPLLREDKILIRKGEVVRVIMNNNTMMHHPMHLHGHFFRVVNRQGEYSPLKHTVDIPPFESLTIEFDANEEGDWFFHCHLLYHMKSGMARVFSYDSERSTLLDNYPYPTFLKQEEQFFQWGEFELSSHQAILEYQVSNNYNSWLFDIEYGWQKNLEVEFRYERYVGKHFRYIAAIDAENEKEDSLNDIEATINVGFRYQLLSILDTEIQIDNQLKLGLTFDLEVDLTKRIALFADYELINDFGLTDTLSTGDNYLSEQTAAIGLEYTHSENMSFTASYDNRFGAGVGVTLRF